MALRRVMPWRCPPPWRSIRSLLVRTMVLVMMYGLIPWLGPVAAVLSGGGGGGSATAASAGASACSEVPEASHRGDVESSFSPVLAADGLGSGVDDPPSVEVRALIDAALVGRARAKRYCICGFGEPLPESGRCGGCRWAWGVRQSD